MDTYSGYLYSPFGHDVGEAKTPRPEKKEKNGKKEKAREKMMMLQFGSANGDIIIQRTSPLG